MRHSAHSFWVVAKVRNDTGFLPDSLREAGKFLPPLAGIFSQLVG
ncbi:hypothetical protein [Erwinia typographi]|nr:hypothetical protein [Erwinia typographi]